MTSVAAGALGDVVGAAESVHPVTVPITTATATANSATRDRREARRRVRTPRV
jgi:hypothetical protein